MHVCRRIEHDWVLDAEHDHERMYPVRERILWTELYAPLSNDVDGCNVRWPWDVLGWNPRQRYLFVFQWFCRAHLLDHVSGLVNWRRLWRKTMWTHRPMHMWQRVVC